ncbi:MAG: protease PrsW [Solirubrobacteraceae bacterium]|nr:protease PrsW [Solirubrobacteraceae bacterium]
MTRASRLRALLRHAWLQTLLRGSVLFIALDAAALATRNINLVPSVIVVGAFLGPVAFVIYVYERAPEVPLPTLLRCFVAGGLLGLAAAAVLEYRTLIELGALPAIAVGLIEETCKLIVPVAILLRWRYRREADGVLFGVASGMGFAAFETMGYGLSALLASQGHIGELERVLLIRGVLSPANHAAWTGLVCAALWRARGRPARRRLWAAAPVAFAVAVGLHALWDTVRTLEEQIPIGVVSLALVAWRIHAAASEPAVTARARAVSSRRGTARAT